MSLQTTIIQILLETIITTISGLIKNLPYFILIIWGVKKISKDMPKWIEQYDKIKMKHYLIEKAIEGRRI